jgi:hypothetical protein
MKSISLASYSNILIQLMRSPGSFFDNHCKKNQAKQAAGFLLISNILFTIAALSVIRFDNPLINGIVLFTNAFGMVLILSVIGYVVMGASVGRKTSFSVFFSVYAYASGTTLLTSWIPSMLLFSEPWRWVLIGIGLRRACDLRLGAIIWVILCSVTMVSILLWTISCQ